MFASQGHRHPVPGQLIGQAKAEVLTIGSEAGHAALSVAAGTAHDVLQQQTGCAVQGKLEEVEQVRERWMADISAGSEELDDDVEMVFTITEKLVTGVRDAVLGMQPSEPVDIQSLQLSKRSLVEQKLAKYSSLGTVSNNVERRCKEILIS